MNKVYIVFKEERVAYNRNPNCATEKAGQTCKVCSPRVWTAFGEEWPEASLPFRKPVLLAVRSNPRDAYQIAQDEEDLHGYTTWVEEHEVC